MKKNNFEEILTETLEKYVRDTEANAKAVSKAEFSKRHEDNMEKLFQAVENGEFGNFEGISIEKSVSTNNLVKTKVKKYEITKFTRIVALILLGLIISLAVAPSMTAWLSEDTEFYGENQDDYAWLLRNDTTEVLESNVEYSGDYLNIFGYLPEGFEIKDVIENTGSKRIVIKNSKNEEINLRILESINRAIDTEEKNVEVVYIEGLEIKYLKFKNRNVFLWIYNNSEYVLYSELELEVVYKILENINFKNF